MKFRLFTVMQFLYVLFIFSIHAENIQKFYYIGDFELENGEKIIDCKIGYRTFGILNADKSNAILYPTWFGGTSENVANLIRPDKLIDSTGFFIIVVDAFGNSVSSSPSNYSNTDFPNITIRDMVKAQHQLLVDHLNIYHLHGIIGGSMGSMQVFEWLVSYPDFMDKALPYVCTPRPSSSDLLIMNIRKQILEKGLKYNIPENEILETYDMLTAYIAHTPEYRIQKTSFEEFSEFFSGFLNKPLSRFNANNRLCQLNALINFNISEKFDGSMKKAAEAIKAEVSMIVSKTDYILNPQPAIDFAKMLNAEIMILENNCGHLAIGCEMEKCGNAVNAFFKQSNKENVKAFG